MIEKFYELILVISYTAQKNFYLSYGTIYFNYIHCHFVLPYQAKIDMINIYVKLYFYNTFYISEIRKENESQVSYRIPEAVGGTLGAIAILVVSVALFLKR